MDLKKISFYLEHENWKEKERCYKKRDEKKKKETSCFYQAGTCISIIWAKQISIIFQNFIYYYFGKIIFEEVRKWRE